MSQRRKCRLINSEYKDIDLRKYEQIITDTINRVLPGKNPKVFKEYFSTDPLTQWESICLGRELSKIDELAMYGKTVTSFRLFDGKTYDSESSCASAVPKRKPVSSNKGGRMT